MKILHVITDDSADLLTEANVYNIKETHDGVSIANFLKHYADSLSNAQTKKMFTKKITAFILNTDKYHYAMRDVPNDAPDWAKKASAQGDLVYFQFDEELKNAVQHIVHYLAALDTDRVGKDKDDKAVASKAYQGFPKAENLEVLVQTSNEYFKRGSKKAGADMSGMTEIFKAEGGFTWYKLTDNSAFRREGKVLQNCIGSHYTLDRCTKDNTSIVVLKSPNNETSVAARIHNGDNEVQEMKGKQNKPPIKKYMKPVAELVNKFKLSFTSGGKHDMVRGGYYPHEGKLYTRDQAIKELVDAKMVAKVGYGLQIVRVTSQNEDIISELYNNKLNMGYRDSGGTIYEVRKSDGSRVLSSYVNPQQELTSWSPENQALTESIIVENTKLETERLAIKELVDYLAQHDLVESFSDEMERELFWENGYTFDKRNKELTTQEHQGKHQEKPEHLEWKEYTDALTVTKMKDIIFSDIGYRHNLDKLTKLKNGVGKSRRVFVASVTTEEEVKNQLVVFESPGKKALPFTVVKGNTKMVNFGHQLDGGYGSHVKQSADKNTIDSILSLINEKGLSLPQLVTTSHGIVKDEKGKHKQIDEPVATELPGTPSASVFDFNSIPDDHKLPAMVYWFKHHKKFGGNGTDGQFNMMERIKKGVGHDGGYSDVTDHHETNKDDSTIIKDIFNDMDKLYNVKVTYGPDNKKHIVLLMAAGNKIVGVNTDTETTKFQSWGDHDVVAEQLNKFAKTNNLTFDKNALSIKGFQTEFRVNRDGTLGTAGAQIKKDIEKKRGEGKYGMEGTDVLNFKDGYKLVRMDPENQPAWAREEGVATKGEVWRIFDEEGTDTKIAFIIWKEKVQRVYQGRGRNLDHESQTFKYLRTAMETFGWGTKSMSKLMLKPGTPDHRLLSRIEAPIKGYRMSRWIGDREKSMEGRGYITITKTANSNKLKITRQGKSALKLLNNNEEVDSMSHMKGAELPDDFVKPERKEVVKPERKSKYKAATGQPRAGTKAEQALNDFTEFVTDNDRIPTRKEFIEMMTAEPYNMGASGAQTYYYTTKAKYNKLNEWSSFVIDPGNRDFRSTFGFFRSILNG